MPNKRKRKPAYATYVMVRVSAEQLNKVNGVAEARGLYVSEMVRAWIDSLPEPSKELAA